VLINTPYLDVAMIRRRFLLLLDRCGNTSTFRADGKLDEVTVWAFRQIGLQ
jgi:hypothetical protein